MPVRARLNVVADYAHSVIVVRPIGHFEPDDFVEEISQAYQRIDEPWRFNRLLDFRRFESTLPPSALNAVAALWEAVGRAHPYHAHVALVSHDPKVEQRIPSLSQRRPHETLRLFSDYHEAFGWLIAADRDAYLAALGRPTFHPEADADLTID